MAAPCRLMFRAIALTRRAGLRALRPPSAPLRRLRDIFLVAQPPLLWEEGSVPRPEHIFRPGFFTRHICKGARHKALLTSESLSVSRKLHIHPTRVRIVGMKLPGGIFPSSQ